MAFARSKNDAEQEFLALSYLYDFLFSTTSASMEQWEKVGNIDKLFLIFLEIRDNRVLYKTYLYYRNCVAFFSILRFSLAP